VKVVISQVRNSDNKNSLANLPLRRHVTQLLVFNEKKCKVFAFSRKIMAQHLDALRSIALKTISVVLLLQAESFLMQ
jgi:hypothetical protein